MHLDILRYRMVFQRLYFEKLYYEVASQLFARPKYVYQTVMALFFPRVMWNLANLVARTGAQLCFLMNGALSWTDFNLQINLRFTCFAFDPHADAVSCYLQVWLLGITSKWVNVKICFYMSSTHVSCNSFTKWSLKLKYSLLPNRIFISTQYLTCIRDNT